MTAEAWWGRGLLGSDEVVTTPDGRRLRMMVGGEGDDLVVLEAGLGVSGLYWGPVHTAISGRVRVVAYERAGFGASTPDPPRRDLDRLAADLSTVIDAIPHRRLVLVGHSWGGPVVRLVASRRLADGKPIDGLVLVDQSDENCSLYFSWSAHMQFAAQAAVMVPLARLRLLAPATRGLLGDLDEPLRSAVVVASTSVAAARAIVAEDRHTVEDLKWLKEQPLDLSVLPITVISGQEKNRLDARVRASLVEAHRTTAAQYPGGRFVPATESGHLVPLSEPELIASEALSLLSWSTSGAEV